MSTDMTEGKAQLAIALSVIAITKQLMEHFSVSHEEAYRKLAGTDFFERLNDIESGLALETDDYLSKACLLELEQGKEAMYDFICSE